MLPSAALCRMVCRHSTASESLSRLGRQATNASGSCLTAGERRSAFVPARMTPSTRLSRSATISTSASRRGMWISVSPLFPQRGRARRKEGPTGPCPRARDAPDGTPDLGAQSAAIARRDRSRRSRWSASIRACTGARSVSLLLTVMCLSAGRRRLAADTAGADQEQSRERSGCTWQIPPPSEATFPQERTNARPAATRSIRAQSVTCPHARAAAAPMNGSRLQEGTALTIRIPIGSSGLRWLPPCGLRA